MTAAQWRATLQAIARLLNARTEDELSQALLRLVAGIPGIRQASIERRPDTSPAPRGHRGYPMIGIDRGHGELRVTGRVGATSHDVLRLAAAVGAAATDRLRFREARQRQAFLEEVAATAAHEIRNPLTAVRGYLQLLQRQSRDAAVQRHVATITREVDRLDALVYALLQLARPLPGDPVVGDVEAVLQEVLDLIEPEAQHRDVEVVRRLRGDLPPLWLRPDRLKQAFFNLAGNALDAMPDGGRLVVETNAGGERVSISFTDTGAGVPPEIRHRIFQPWFTTKQGGTGLGLALCRSVAEEHGGCIAVENVPGGGARFIVSLPVPPREQEEAV